jgi:7-cyano-7-deazaguanine synthase in queuosine biosynthesis
MTRSSHVVLCNRALKKDIPSKYRKGASVLSLAYDMPDPTVEIGLPQFVSSVYHLPARVLDLLEIAAYIFCTDRSISRGAKDLVEYDAWGREIHYVIRVRDKSFWSRRDVSECLSRAITWATGDRNHTFTFVAGHSTQAVGLFDSAGVQFAPHPDSVIALFSGGIDSLTGVVQYLENNTGHICLVSHRSSSDVQSTQAALLAALNKRYPNRIHPYHFTVRLKGKRAAEETQRSRSFLFCAIAYSLMVALKQNKFTIYENGVTSLNFPKREGMGLARASRTTHPQTLRFYEEVLALIHERPVAIDTPYFWKTKTDVLLTLKESCGSDLLDTTVSCTRTFENADTKTHCGGCSQCVDRRFAALAAGMFEQDHAGLYTKDFINDPIESGEARTLVVDFLGQAKDFATSSADKFIQTYLTELIAVEEHLQGVERIDRLTRIFELCRRHGQQVMYAAGILNDPTRPVKPGTVAEMINTRAYLQTPIVRLVEDVCERLARGIPLIFAHQRPTNEDDFNDKVDGLLNGWRKEFAREHPCASFARAKMVPDHLDPVHNFLVESKYLRGATTPSKVTDGLGADMFKLPPEFFKLLLVYDPDRSITNDDEFRKAFEIRGNCRVLVVR